MEMGHRLNSDAPRNGTDFMHVSPVTFPRPITEPIFENMEPGIFFAFHYHLVLYFYFLFLFF